MKNRTKRAFRYVSLALTVLLLCNLLTVAGFATEVTEPEQTTSSDTVAVEQPQTKGYVVDTESAVYKACQEVADTIDATQILVYDATSDEILYSKSVQGSKLYPASTTKLFSTYVALQYLAPDTVITAGDELDMLQPGSSIAYISKDHQLTAEMLVEGMLLPSGNDAALVLAAAAGKAIAGDDSLSGADAVQAFVAEMNRMAEELGFEKSHFANPDGYHVGAHYTCVDDMARIAKQALENPIISKYMATFETDVVYASGHSNHWINTNHLLDPESDFYYPGTLGMKTGHTNQAGYCLMSAFKQNGHTLVIGVFGYPGTEARFQDVIKLLDACK
ncbi:MAG: D-alanyl-D-alanine carboxypeptidase [Oscillospiraceae bacterium]|nr:D-alanyl-D-alanine carboxypeptidase [Oscillospiraceae bacterium]